MVTFLNQLTVSHTIKSLLKWAFLALKETSASPELDAEVILSFVIGKNKEYLHTHSEKRIIGKREQKFKRLIGRRKKHEPVAYIIGSKEFCGLNFKVNRDVLIPRSETEMMVEDVLEIAENVLNKFSDKSAVGREILGDEKKLEISARGGSASGGRNWKFWDKTIESIGNERKINRIGNEMSTGGNNVFGITLIDIGTGSGCIPIAVAKNLIRIYGRIYARIYGIDISPKALKIAKENARLNGVGRYMEFLHGDLLDVLSCGHKSKRERALVQVKKRGMSVVIITANLPYLPQAVYRKCTEDVKNYEPKEALVAGRDGLKYYRRLFREVKTSPRLSLLIRSGVILCEIDPTQNRAIKTLAKEYFSNARVEIKKDLCGLARLAVIRVPPSALRIQERGTQ